MSQPFGTMVAQWTDPDGGVWPLTNHDPAQGWFTPPGPAGWGAPPVDLVTDSIPRGGEDLRAVRARAARITWPLHVYGDSHQGFITNLRTIRRAFLLTTARQKTGTLRVTRPDGTAREIDAYYEDGFGGQAGEGWGSANPILTLMCPDGFWRDTTPMTVSRSFAAGTSFLAPYPTVSSAQVLGASVINNPGDVNAWPVWTITGPATTITATNNTTGQSFVLTVALNAGDLVTITTQKPSVVGPLGQSLVNGLNWPAAYLWPLIPGDNSVNFAVAGAATGTAISLTFYPRWVGA